MVDRDVFDRRREKFDEWLRRLRGIAEVDLDTFLGDPGLQAQAERWTHLVVESALDLGNHLIADRDWRSPTTNREVFRVLADHDVIDADLGRRLEGWAGLRNLLVHLYLEIDHRQIHRILRNDLDELRDFGRAIEQLVYAED
ncbi:MAG: DUF86 domain-containing protein [Acidobacteriota bacterium]